MNRTRIVAALAALVVVAGGCSIEPAERAAEAPPVTTDADQPAELAFTEEQPAPAAQEPQAEPGSAAAFTLATDTATVGVHSAPDHVFTRLGTLSPGANVLATGREVEVDDVIWMEIHWREHLAWVVALAFEPLST